MGKNRLEAFSDGVLAIIITIMVLEIRPPAGTEWLLIKPLIPKFVSYALSFVFVAIYWNNHHHLLHTVKKITPGIMWANNTLLFWLSLIPFATAWMGQTQFERITVAAYATLALFCGASYNFLEKAIVNGHPDDNYLKEIVKPRGWKSLSSVFLYLISIPISLYVSPVLAGWIFFTVAMVWLVPDKSIEKALNSDS